MKRPWSVWLLLLYFVFSLFVGVRLLFEESASAEAQLYERAGIEAVFFVLLVASVMLNAVTIRYLWAPQPTGLRVGLASVTVGLVFASITAMVAASQPELFREVVLAKSEASGQAVDPSALEFVTSGKGLGIALGFAAVKAAAVAALLLWNRSYFGVSSPQATSSSAM